MRRPIPALDRRGFLAAMAGLPLIARAAAPAARELRFRVNAEGFGDAAPADIIAVARSAAESIWAHCPNTRFDAGGIQLYHRDDCPMCNHDRTDDGWIAIGLASAGRLWAQMTFQFAHEFAHALTTHSNDWRRLARGTHANSWLEESLCETASLFALRAMGRTWVDHPPYPNWADYARHLTDYAAGRLAGVRKTLPDDADFPRWLRGQEPSLRKNGTQREINTAIAARLLPRFEADPAGWETLTVLNVGPRQPDALLADHLARWTARVPESGRNFLRGVARILSADP